MEDKNKRSENRRQGDKTKADTGNKPNPGMAANVNQKTDDANVKGDKQKTSPQKPETEMGVSNVRGERKK